MRDWTNAAVLEYRLLRWDYQLLKTHHVPLADYDRTRDQFTRLNKGSKAETKTVHSENFLEQKRLLLTKLQELRAAAGQAMNEDLRAARAAIIVDKDCVHKAQGSLPKEILCHHNMMLKLPSEQANMSRVSMRVSRSWRLQQTLGRQRLPLQPTTSRFALMAMIRPSSSLMVRSSWALLR